MSILLKTYSRNNKTIGDWRSKILDLQGGDCVGFQGRDYGIYLPLLKSLHKGA